MFTFLLRRNGRARHHAPASGGAQEKTPASSLGRAVSPPISTPVCGKTPDSVRGPRDHRVDTGGIIRPPTKTLDARPVYPPSMRDAGLEGVVPIDAVIGTDGSVTSVRVVSAQVHPAFAIAAVDAVRQWRFTPTLLNGDAVEVVMTVSVEFNLSENEIGHGGFCGSGLRSSEARSQPPNPAAAS